MVNRVSYTDLEACVIRLEDRDGQTRGTGFVVSPSLAVTCAHVVEACDAGPGERVRVVFHAGGEPVEAEVLAAGWHPEADVAFLRLPELLPEGVTPAILTPSVGREGARVRAFGYPEVGKVENLWGTGELIGRVMEAGRKLLQLRSGEITVGFSGGPVWDATSGRVIGMVTQIATPDRYGKLGEVAFAVPAETVHALRIGEFSLHYTLRLGIPFQAPPLPPHFVPRPEVSEALKTHLLTGDGAAPGALVISAIHGLGGIGKSVLAAALAHDPQVQEHFQDGVLWATLGQEPDFLSLLSNWIINALHDYNYKPTTVEAASTHLRTLLQDKAALLVVDDVWDPDHARPFLATGPHCRVLITTRRADVADDVGADLYQLDVMVPEQSLDLLSARLGRPLAETEREEALRLAGTVGYLPLALELAAVRVMRGTPWTVLCEALEEEIARLEALEDPRRRRWGHTRLEATFNLSLNALRTSDEEAWQAFVWLGVLPEGVQIAAPAAATLWEMGKAEVADMLELLWNDALLLPSLLVWVGEREWPAYRLHNLLHDMARRLLTTDQPQGLGLTLPQAHTRLLERYRTQARESLWHTLPDDGYIHARLTWHMERAGWAGELHVLLQEETAEGWNGWYEARERLGQTAGYLADLERAWQQAEKEFANRQSPPALGRQCRYALITASLKSLSKNMLPALLVALVKKGLLAPVQGLAYIQQTSDAGERAARLAWFAPHLPEPLQGNALREALQTARTIEDEEYRARALAGLVPHLPEPLSGDILWDALVAARQIEDPEWQVTALERLAPDLPEPLSGEVLRETLAAARQIEDVGRRAVVLKRLASDLPESLGSEALREALAAAQQIESSSGQGWMLEELAFRLVELGHPEDALAAVRAIRDEWKRAKMLRELATRLSEPLSGEALREALAAAQQIESSSGQRWMLEELAFRLVELGHPEDALAAVRAIRDEWKRARTLGELATRLSEPLLWDALAAVREIKNAERQVEALTGLAPHLPEQLLHRALATARAIKDGSSRANALAGLAPYLPEPLLQEALTVARTVEDERERAEALAGLARHLPRRLLPELIAVMETIESINDRAGVLTGLAPRLGELGYQREMLAAVQAIEQEWVRAKALVGLAPHLPEELVREVLTVAQEIEGGDWRADVLAELALRLAELGYPQDALATIREIVSKHEQIEEQIDAPTGLPTPFLETLEGPKWMTKSESTAHDLVTHLEEMIEETRAMRAVGDPWRQMEVLAKLAPRLAELGYPQEALATVQEIKDQRRQAIALTDLTTQLVELGHCQEAMAAAREIGDGWERTKALAGLAPRLAELGYHQEALATAQEIRDQREQAIALTGLVTQLMELGHCREALVAAREIADGWERTEALSELAPHLPEEYLREALTVAQEIEDGDWRAHALARLAPYLPEPLRGEALHEGLTAARAIKDESSRVNALAGLAPYLPKPLLREALAVVQAIWDTGDRVWAQAELASRLSEPVKDEALQEVLAAMPMAEHEWWRAKVLAGLALCLVKLGYHKEALAAARIIEDAQDQAKALVWLTPHLPEPMKENSLRNALAATQGIEGAEARARVLTMLVPYALEPLRGEVLREALAAVWVIEEVHHRMKALVRLASHLPEPLLQEALAAVQAIEDEQERVKALVELAPHLPEPLLREGLAAVWGIKGTHSRMEALAKLAPHLPEPLLQEALAIVRMIEDEWERAEMLVKLTPCLPEPLLREALAVARAIENEWERAKALTQLAPHLPEPLLREALAAVWMIKRMHSRMEALVELVPHLPEPLRGEALHEGLIAVRAIEYGWDRVKVLIGLASYLSEPSRGQTLQEALVAARKLEDTDDRVQALSRLAPLLGEPLTDKVLREALVAAQTIENLDDRAWALEELALSLAEFGHHEEALTAAQAIQEGWLSSKARVLEALALRLAELGHREEALTAAQAIPDRKDQGWALEKLAVQLAELGHREEALAAAQAIRDGWCQARALEKLTVWLAELGRPEEALAAVQVIEDEGERVKALAKLAPHLPEPLLREALAVARLITHKHWRAEALTCLGPHLAELSHPVLTHLWLEEQDGANLLHALTNSTRKDLLADIRALAPVIHKLGGEEAIAEAFRAIQDVGRWWS